MSDNEGGMKKITIDGKKYKLSPIGEEEKEEEGVITFRIDTEANWGCFHISKHNPAWNPSWAEPIYKGAELPSLTELTKIAKNGIPDGARPKINILCGYTEYVVYLQGYWK